MLLGVSRGYNSWMRPRATDGVSWSVCVSARQSVGHVREPCKNG